MMKLSKLLLAVVGATVLLGAYASAASAGRLSYSSNTFSASWTRFNFAGTIGTVECETIINGTFHSRTITKTRGLLTGFITAAAVTRCARGGATILRETLPWHRQYDSFTGSLPIISGIRTSVLGFSVRIRDPTFGIECLAGSTAAEPLLLFSNLTSGVDQSLTASGTLRCGSFSLSISGTSSSTSRVTITLI